MPPQVEIKAEPPRDPRVRETAKAIRRKAGNRRAPHLEDSVDAQAAAEVRAQAAKANPDVDPAFESETPGENEPTTVVITESTGDKREDKGPPKEAKSGIPSLDEWQDFIGRIVLRTLTDGYVTLMLRDIELTEREERQIFLSKEDLKDMAAPFASVANKSKLARKHGRLLISLTDSYEAVIALMIWARRVNRIAKKHRAQEPVQGTVVNPTVANGAASNGRSHRPNAEQGPREGEPGFRVFNPGTG